MSATGAAGAIAGAIGGGITAGMVSTVASIAFQVTGINDKINKAASKVFGEDLVKFANIAGAGYAMFNGGFDIGGAGEAATDAAAFDADWAAATGGSAMTGEEVLTSGMDSFNLSDMAKPSTDAAFDSDFAAAESEKFMPTETKGMSLTKPDQPLNTDSKLAAAETKPVSATTDTGATPPKMVEPPKPVTTGAAAPGATTQSATAKIATTPQAPVPGATTQPNLFNRLFFDPATGKMNERMVGGVLQGVGSAYTSAQQMAQRQKEIDAENARRNSLAPGRMY